MKFLAITALSIATLSLSACATYAPHGADETPQKMKKVMSGEMLLSGISADKITPEGTSPVTLSQQDPTCVSFYKNAATFASVSAGAPKAPGGGFATGLLKTIAFGTVAGAASGGVGSLGIGSSFLELALAGAANQVAFQGSSAAFNAVTGAGTKDAAAAATALSPYQKIEAASAKIGCPAPDAGPLGLDPVNALTTGDHTHSAGEHTHTTGGHTYSHTH